MGQIASAAAVERMVTQVVTANRQLEGAGFQVRRPIPSPALGEQLDPYLLLDHLGPADLRPGEAKGAPWHPHRGFQTISYLLDGELVHKDSAGNTGTLRPGDFQLMTAGAGIIHDESPSEDMMRRGGTSEGFQIWVNLDRANKMIPPSYQDVSAEDIPRFEGDHFYAKVAAGEAFGLRGPVETLTPIHFVDVHAKAGACIEHDLPLSWSLGIYVYRGTAIVGDCMVSEGQLGVCGYGDDQGASQSSVRVTVPEAARFLLLAGKPLREPLARYGPFVMTTRDELLAAFSDYQSGNFGKIPATFKSRTQHRGQFDPAKHSLLRDDL